MKNMIKAVAFAVTFVLTMSASADDSYLWWMVSDTTGTQGVGAWDYATVTVFDGEGNNVGYLAPQNGSGVIGYDKTGNYAINSAQSYIPSTYTEGYTFLIELWTDSDAWVAKGLNPVGYAALADYIYAGSAGQGSLPYDFGAGGWSAVPEPSSGMLMLIGMSLLALRRKNQKKA